MIGSYAKGRVVEQIKTVSFIIVYLIAFQTLILRTPPVNALQIAVGIGMVVFGLSFFLEGLLIGVMPLGERVGVQLPKHTGIVIIALFGVLVGFGSTLAEPSVAALRTVGGTVTAWDTPILFIVLERYTEFFVMAIGIGVGVAVALGLFRFYYGLSLKPFIYIMIPILLAVTTVFSLHESLASIVGLAWDSGAVTTGAVTVPLVLALGIGVSRGSGAREGSANGFGIVALASMLPILAVLILGFFVNSSAPDPVDEATFFSPHRRSVSMKLFETEEEMLRYAFTRGTETGRRAFFEKEDEYEAAVDSLRYSVGARRELLGTMSVSTWLEMAASIEETERFSPEFGHKAEHNSIPPQGLKDTVVEETVNSVRAIVPLTLLLLVVLLLFLRDRPRYTDELILGIIFALFGMALLTSGMKLGLTPLGDGVGRQLPRVFRSDPEDVEKIIIENFERDIVFESIGQDGRRRSYFYLHENGTVKRTPFIEKRYNSDAKRYEHVVSRNALFGPKLTLLGIGLVFLFAFGLGYGSTLAEPALNALGRTVEQLTVGTIRRRVVINVVALGVGIGLMAGIARILYDIPITWLLLPPYLLLLPLTWANEENFAAIAWDSGGVTTGVITVPLVLAMGLGVGGELNISEGFGILALASVFPILSLLVYGLISRMRLQRTIRAVEKAENDE